jgi:hypothetical protein
VQSLEKQAVLRAGAAASAGFTPNMGSWCRWTWVTPTQPISRPSAGWPGLLVNPGGATARGQCTTGPWTSRRSATPVASNWGHPR